MPKDDIDPDDPMELRGVGLLTSEDTTEAMTECVIEEFLRLNHTAAGILALFRDPQYTGVHMVLQNRGEAFVKGKIAEVFAWWNRPVHWDGGSLPAGPALPVAAPIAGSGAAADPRSPALPGAESGSSPPV